MVIASECDPAILLPPAAQRNTDNTLYISDWHNVSLHLKKNQSVDKREHVELENGS